MVRCLCCLMAACLAALVPAACDDPHPDGDGDVDGDSDADGDSDSDVDEDGEADGDGDGDAGWPARFDPFVETLLDDLEGSTAYGVSVAVMEDGVVTFAEAFDSRDPDGAEPLRPSTLMQIGSTTKHMTATGLLRLVDGGHVSLDDTLESLLPELEFALDPTWDDQITLHLLLSHQSGLDDLVPWRGSPLDGSLASWTYRAWDEDAYLMSPPGAFWNYSNPGFVLAGLVTEVMDDRPWPDIMREDVFLPLGMDRTFARKAEVEDDGDYSLSYGIGLSDLGTGRESPLDMDDVGDAAWVRPAGLVWTTPTQMMLWADFVMRGDPSVLSDELRAEITRGQVDTLYQMGTMLYGYGMFVEGGYLTLDGTWYETPVWEHGGNTLSFSNLFYMLPEHDFALAICSSGFGTDFQPSVDAAVTTLVDLPDPTPAPEYEIDPTQLDRHVGHYLDPWNVGEMEVTRHGDALQISMPLLDEHGIPYSPDLVPLSTDIFYVDIDGAELDLTFIPLEAGGPSHYVRNRSFVAVREPEGKAREPLGRPLSRQDVVRWLIEARLEPSPHLRYLRARAAR